MRAPDAEDLKRLIEKYSRAPDFDDPNITTLESRTVYGDQLLHAACVAGEVEDIEDLISLGADINSKGEDGYTPLHYAIEQGHVDAVRLLVQEGADVSIRNSRGESSLDMAENVGEDTILGFLLNSEAGQV